MVIFIFSYIVKVGKGSMRCRNEELFLYDWESHGQKLPAPITFNLHPIIFLKFQKYSL